MLTSTTAALWIVRITGPIQVLLGLLFWTGHALPLLPLHLGIGMAFVLALWVLAGLAAWAGLRPALVALVAAWGLIIPAFGMAQTRLLLGPAHWVVQAAHLLIGLLAMVMAARLARFIRSRGRSSCRPTRPRAGARWRASAGRALRRQRRAGAVGPLTAPRAPPAYPAGRPD